MKVRARILLGLVAAAIPVAVIAQTFTTTVAISPTAAPTLGRVVGGTSVSTFSVDASSGTVTRLSGNAVRLTSGSVTTPTITVVCKTNCANSRVVNVTITAGAVTGRTSITNFTYSNFSSSHSGTTTSGSTTGSPLTFAIQFPTGNGGTDKSATFKLGMTTSVATTGARGDGAFAYTVSVVRP
jgi:hypothetical protein